MFASMCFLNKKKACGFFTNEPAISITLFQWKAHPNRHYTNIHEILWEVIHAILDLVYRKMYSKVFYLVLLKHIVYIELYYNFKKLG